MDREEAVLILRDVWEEIPSLYLRGLGLAEKAEQN